MFKKLFSEIRSVCEIFSFLTFFLSCLVLTSFYLDVIMTVHRR